MLYFLDYWGVDAHCVCTSSLLLCSKVLVSLHLTMAALCTLILPNSDHFLWFFLYSSKCSTSKSAYCAVFSPLLGRLDASCVGTSFLLLCSKELVCFHIPMAAPSTLILPLYHHLLWFFLDYRKCIT